MYLFKLVFSFSLDKHPEMELLGCMDCVVVVFLIFEEPPYCFPVWLHQFPFPTNDVLEFFFFHSLANTYFYLFNNTLEKKEKTHSKAVSIAICLFGGITDHPET